MDNLLKKIGQQFSSLHDPALNPIINVLLIFAVAAISWWIFNGVMRRFEKRYQEQPFFHKNKNFFILIRRAGHYSIMILVGIGLLNLVHVPIIEKVFYAFMIMLLASFTNGITMNLLPYLEDKLTARTESKIDDVIIRLLNKFASIIIFITASILALDVLGVNIMPFIAGAGVAGIAIGFAAKDTLSNVIAGILLIIDRPFEIGDRIEVWSAPKNSSTWGDVLEIGLRATKIRTTDNIVIVIPNNEIMMRDIINYTSITKEIRVRIPIGIAYDANIQKAKEIIAQVSLELDWVMRDPGPRVVVKNFGDSAVNLEARIWISRPRKRMDTISHITDRVKEVFQQEGIEIPFPKRDIYIKTSETKP
ncbi:MAG: mechanosensitive ion channel family protein [Thermodesulfobacteriota bacterium]|nr:mechanosensitive ion channel family protein [Thermodesulfobacteriota bacterium]